MTHIEKINPPELQEPQGFVHVTVATGSKLVYLAGQVGTTQDGTVVGDDLAAQTAQALRNVKTALDAAGATLEDVVKSVIYVVDWQPEKFEQLMAGVLEAAPDIGGAPVSSSTLVGVGSLFDPSYLVEFDVTAVVE
jgi:enamine deaminase RidA (YjgF/YER057c/UK114 family)